MSPAVNKRRSVNGRSSPRGFPVGGIRKPSSFRSRRPGIFADKKQVNVLQRGLNVLNKDGGSGAGAGIAGSRFDLTSSKKVPMKVAVRVRPLNARENTANSCEILTVSGPKMLVFDPEREKEDFYFKNQKVKDVTAKKHKNISFAFDNVYDEHSTNAKIYEDIMKPALDTLLSGFNCSVFAYGPTGSGKTYTMLGCEGNPGLTYLTISDLYRRLDGMKEDFHTGVKMSYFEVYNEQVHDLINYTTEPLQIMEVGRGRLTVKNLSEHLPENVDQLFEMLTEGNKNRSQHPTDHNAESSRSHAILQVSVSMNEKHSSSETSKKAAKLVMVDLAGSEKGCATGFSGARFQEGSSINKSLLALGKIMETLASGKKAYTYRDSKLTRILKDSLGGNSRTVMIANVSPAAAMYEDTLNTLRYAQKAKKISCDASKNVITVKSCMTEYTRVVDELATKIQKLEKENKKKDDENDLLHEDCQMFKSQRDEARKQVSAFEEENSALRARIAELESSEREMDDVKNESMVVPGSNGLNMFDYNFRKSGKLLEQTELNIKGDTTFTQPEGTSIIPNGIDVFDSFEEHCVWGQAVNGVLRPKLEKLYLEFRMKLEQIKVFKGLLGSTGDVRYGKAVRRICKKMATIIKELRTVYTHLISMTAPVPINASNDQKYTMKYKDLLRMNSYRVGYYAAVGETTVLHNQVSSLAKEVQRKDSILVELARLTNTMCNILKHYGHLTPALEEEYEKAIASVCSPSLQFVENEEYTHKMDTLFAPQPDLYGFPVSNDENMENKILHCRSDIEKYNRSVESRLNSISSLVEDIPEFDTVSTQFESSVTIRSRVDKEKELESVEVKLSNILKTPVFFSEAEMENMLEPEPDTDVLLDEPTWLPNYEEKFEELGNHTFCLDLSNLHSAELNDVNSDSSHTYLLTIPNLYSTELCDNNSGASTLTSNETVMPAVDSTFTLLPDNEDEENVAPGFYAFKTHADTISEIISTHLPEYDTATTPSSSSSGSLSTGRSPSLLIPPKQYKSNLLFPTITTPAAEVAPGLKPATGLMKPPMTKPISSDQRRTEVRFAGQLPGNGAPLKLASNHNFKGHSSSVSPPATKGYQIGIGAKPKFGSSAGGGKMPSSKIAPQRKSPYSKSKKVAVSTLRKSCSTSNLCKVRPAVNSQQSKAKQPQQFEKSKWQPPNPPK